MPRSAYLLLLALALLVAAALRLPALNLRPFHGDEAVHAYKLNEILHGRGYQYDPHEFHGPTLNLFTLPVAWLRGAADYAALEMRDFRMAPVAFGLGLIALLPLIADGLGRTATAVAGLLTAVSPLLTFCSRYYVQEVLLVFFSLLLIACGWRCVRSRSAGGRAAWALGAGAALGLMHATKETCIIALGAMGFGLAGAWLLRRGIERVGDAEGAGHAGGADDAGGAGDAGGADDVGSADDAGGAGRAEPRFGLRAVALLAGVGAALTSALLFSWFGTHPRGVLDSVLAYGVYLRRGAGETVHVHPWWYYLKMLVWHRLAPGPVWSEALIVGLGAIGAAAIGAAAIGISAARDRRADTAPEAVSEVAPDALEHCCGETNGRSPGRADGHPAFLVFVALYTLGLIVIYSALPYKTPWSMLGFVHGLCLLGGVGAAALLRAASGSGLRRREGANRDVDDRPRGAAGRYVDKRARVGAARCAAVAAVAGVLVAAAVQLGVQSYRTNLDPRFVADHRNPYVYAHPLRGVETMADFVERLAAAHPDGRGMLVKVATPNPWPVPWYLRGLANVGYWGSPPTDCDAPVVIGATDGADLADCLRGEYADGGPYRYSLRPDVALLVYVEAGLMERFRARERGEASP